MKPPVAICRGAAGHKISDVLMAAVMPIGHRGETVDSARIAKGFVSLLVLAC